MDRAELIRDLNALGRTMRLVALNMDNGAVPTEILIQTLVSQRALIDTVLPHIPRNEVINLNTRLGENVENLIAADFPDIPDFPPEHWST